MRSLIILIFSCFSGITFGQITEREIILKKRDIEISKENEQVHALETANGDALEIDVVLRKMTDMDDDGMDDDWEVSNGLNPNDNKDAWLDKDGDAINNLFEFQLSTDPNSATDPNVRNYNHATDDFDNLIAASDGDILVLRISEGVYDFSNLTFFEQSARLLIQGGWNASFTDHNPDLYPTRVIGTPSNEVLYFSTISSVENPLKEFTVILDGLEITEGGGFFGNVNYIAQNVTKACYIVHNCKLTKSAKRGTTLHAWGAEEATIFFVNTEVSGSADDGLYNQTTTGSNLDLRLYNVTSSDNSNNGFRNLISPGSIQDFQCTNVIIKNNIFRDISLDIETRVTMRNSNYTFSDIAITNPDTSNVLDEDPLFNSPNDGDFSLANSSPCINSGLDIGIPFAETAPEMGAYEFGDIMSATENLHDADIGLAIYPNPSIAGQAFNIKYDITEIHKEAELQIFNTKGKIVFESKIRPRSNEFLSTQLTTGLYFIRVITGDKSVLLIKHLVL